jgi:hypothetical protein
MSEIGRECKGSTILADQLCEIVEVESSSFRMD